MDKPWIRDTTKINYQQLMKYATDARKTEFESKAINWAVSGCFGHVHSVLCF